MTALPPLVQIPGMSDSRDAHRLADEAPDKELYRINIRHARVAKHASEALRSTVTAALTGGQA